jgi:hypothetical protein
MKLIDGKMVLEDDDILQEGDLVHWADGTVGVLVRQLAGGKMGETFPPPTVSSIKFIERPLGRGGSAYEQLPNTQSGEFTKPCHETEHEWKRWMGLEGEAAYIVIRDKMGWLKEVEVVICLPCSDPNGCRMEGVVRVKKWHF